MSVDVRDVEHVVGNGMKKRYEETGFVRVVTL